MYISEVYISLLNLPVHCFDNLLRHLARDSWCIHKLLAFLFIISRVDACIYIVDTFVDSMLLTVIVLLDYVKIFRLEDIQYVIVRI